MYKTSSKDKNVIFDPATYPEDSLAEGMEIVEIEGKKYLQVIVDEWEQTVHLADSVIIPLGIEKISFDIMYASGTSGLDINNAWYKYLFQSPEGIELFNAEGDANTVKKLTSLVTDCNGKIGSSNGLYISSLLIAGQNKSGWVAVSGDTVWIGKTSFVEPTNMNSDDPNVNAPLSYELAQNYPNPFNPSTTISYSLPAREMVELVIYDTLGRKIATLVNEPKESGRHRVEFENPELSSGAYFYCFKAGNYVDTKKMVFLK